MKDPEWIRMRNRFIIGLCFVILFMIPFYFFFKNRFAPDDSLILQEMDKKNSFVLLITEKNCSKCKTMKELLKQENVEYKEVVMNKDKNFENIRIKANLSKDDIIPPTIVYMKKKKVTATLVDGDETDVLEFIHNYKLNKEERD